MEVKPNYKQSEVGVIPEAWEVKQLRSINFDISDGNYSSKYQRWSCFLRQAVKVDSAMKRVIHHEDAETVFG
jgi:hypothetical protein